MNSHNQLIDSSKPTRTGEELDTEKLTSYLRAHIPDLRSPVEVEQFPSGFSNLTYLLRAGDREMVLRRPPVGAKIKSAERHSNLTKNRQRLARLNSSTIRKVWARFRVSPAVAVY